MADTQETITDIIAEKRRSAEHIRNNLSTVPFRQWDQQAEIESLEDEADRIEAANKRERGDCAKLRAALKLCMDELCDRCRDLASARGNPLPCLQGCEPIRKAKAALAAPPRNCDIYLTEEAVDAATVTVRDCEACSRIDMEAPCVFCMVRWLLAPAQEKEGGAK